MPTKLNPYVFVVGCPRSGTTLLQRMLNSHPQLAVANDTHFIPRVIKKHKQTNPPLNEELIEQVHTYKRFCRLGLSNIEVMESAKCAENYQEFVSALYRTFGNKQGKPLAGEKTPDYCRHIPLLHSLFPWAKFVHIIRDGRDVTLSTLDWANDSKGPGKWELWQESPIATCALWWRWQVNTGRKDGAVLTDKYMEILYENLIAKPEESLRKISTFLEIPFSSKMLTFYEGKTKHNPNLSAKSAWLPPTQGLRNWQKQMSAHDLALFELLAGEFLEELSYQRLIEDISQEISEKAQTYHKWWNIQKEKPKKANQPKLDPVRMVAV